MNKTVIAKKFSDVKKNCDEKQILMQDSICVKTKNSNCDNTLNLNCDKTQILTNLKTSNCEKSKEKLQLLQNSKTQIVRKL